MSKTCRGYAIQTAPGKHKNKKTARQFALFASSFLAMDEAEKDAHANCPEGRKCLCQSRLVAKPSAFYLGKNKKNGMHVFIGFAWAECIGKCSGEASRPDTASPGTIITALGFDALRRLVMELPKAPTGTQDLKGCRLYRKKMKRGVWMPVCMGNCKKGKECYLSIRIKGKLITIKCQCL